jgi:hypothetical protein
MAARRQTFTIASDRHPPLTCRFQEASIAGRARSRLCAHRRSARLNHRRAERGVVRRNQAPQELGWDEAAEEERGYHRQAEEGRSHGGEAQAGNDSHHPFRIQTTRHAPTARRWRGMGRSESTSIAPGSIRLPQILSKHRQRTRYSAAMGSPFRLAAFLAKRPACT